MSLPTPYYDRNGITIYCGDCREILPELPQVDLVLTDPPYNHRHMDGGGFDAATSFYRGGALDGMNDFVLRDYERELSHASDQIIAFHSRDGIMAWSEFIYRCFGSYDLHVWYKVNAIPFTHNTWKSDLEYIALGWRGTKQHAPVEQHIKSKCWVTPIDTGNLHPAQKPLGLMSKYIRVLAPSLVLDPFMGSGSTLRAALNLGRKCIGIEISEKYCEIAVKRLAQEVMSFPHSP